TGCQRDESEARVSGVFRAGSPSESTGRNRSPAYSFPETVRVALRTAKWSSPEKTRWSDRPSALIHLVGKLADSPGPTSHFSVKNTVVHGPHGSGASYTPKPPSKRVSAFCPWVPGMICTHR